MKIAKVGLAVVAALTSVTVQASEPGGPKPWVEEFEDSEASGNAERTFEYSFTKAIFTLTPLADLIRAREAEALAKQKAEWNEAVEEFGDMGCITCVARAYTNTWEVASQIPRFMIVRSETWVYTGGAHGNGLFGALAWDRMGGADRTGAALKPVDMFVSETALENTAFGDYCQALLEVKAERLDLDITKVNPFDGCPSVGELVVIPLTTNGGEFDRVQFLAAPYVAGSFAEGPYEFEIPITPAILAAVKPEYREHFKLPVSD